MEDILAPWCPTGKNYEIELILVHFIFLQKLIKTKILSSGIFVKMNAPMKKKNRFAWHPHLFLTLENTQQVKTS